MPECSSGSDTAVRIAELPPILVVDDQPNIRQLFATALESAGYHTLQAEDGQQALDVIEKTPVSLVLLDCQMPRMNGLQCLEALREREATRSLPVILVTGLTDVGDRVRGLAAGANDYLTKPPSLEELLARVRAHLRDRSYWTNLFERDLRDRRAIAGVLGRAHAETAPEETAQRILDQLADIIGLPAIALVRHTPQGDMTPIAARGALTRAFAVGVPTATPVARALEARMTHGPHVEVPRGEEAGDPWGNTLADLGVRAAAYAPMHHGESLAGLLVVGLTGTRSRFPREELAHRLPALMDFTNFAGALLGPRLAAGAETTRARAAMKQILADRAFRPVFQPIVNIHDYRVVGYEALTRFVDGARPDLRFAEASALGMGLELEIACLDAALRASAALAPEAYLSLNVSPSAILENRALAAIRRATPRELVLEVTEHVPIDDYFMLRAGIQDLGPDFEVAVDDAGAGFSSMRHILELHPAVVKLDIGLIRGIPNDPAQQALVAGMAYFGSRTDCRMIAEGVETEAELLMLRQLGISYGQGYLLGKPAPVDDTPK